MFWWVHLYQTLLLCKAPLWNIGFYSVDHQWEGEETPGVLLLKSVAYFLSEIQMCTQWPPC